MKGMKGQVVPMEKLKWPLIAQRKFDGVRLLTTVREGKVTFTTYNGHTIPLPNMAAQVESLPNVMLDAEIVFRDGSMQYRSKVSGMMNSARQGGRISERELNLHAFDSMPLAEWDAKKCNRLYPERYEGTVRLVHGANYDGPSERAMVHLALNEIVRTPDDVNTRVEQLWADGYEGMMLKEPNHRYTFTKSRLWAKLKQTKTADLMCIGVTEGTGWCEGMIGALQLTGIVEGKTVHVKTGSGLTATDRCRPPEYYIGKTIEMKYNSLTQDARTLRWSLFSPRYVMVRMDK
jgi:ATP-dependent DNA ligase